MNKTLKQKTPVIFLVFISLFWGWYYQSNGWFNEFGTANYEWLYLLDGLLVLPILCFLCIKDRKEAAIKALAMSCVVVLVGSYIIPETSKFIWPYLESGRYVALAILLWFELVAIAMVFLAIKTALNRDSDPDLAIFKPVTRFLGRGSVAKIVMFEARIWTYALFSERISGEQFDGKLHFSYHNKDGAINNSLGFVILILIELPLVHLLAHFIWSPTAANVLTLLTLFGLLFFVAEYRAMSRRPVSLFQDKLVIRYGLYTPVTIALKNIASIEPNRNYIPRSKKVKRYNYAGTPNITITLVQSIGQIKKIYIGVDNPVALIDEVVTLCELESSTKA